MPRFFRAPGSDATATMRAASYERHGSSAVLTVADNHARPTPRSGQLLLRVLATSVNPVDVKFRKHPILRKFRPLPKVPCADVCGEVVDTGDPGTAARFALGVRVFALMPLVGWHEGAAAEYAAVPAELCVLAPRHASPVEAASLPLVTLTVLQGLESWEAAWRRFAREGHDTAAPPRALVHGASGGVGTIAVQYLRNVLGCHVIATCSATKAAMVRDLGANETIDYHSQRFEDVCGAVGVDVVFDVLPYVYRDRTLSMLCAQPRPAARHPPRAGARPPLPHYVHIASSDPTVDVGGRGADWLGMAIPEASPGALCHLGWSKIASWFRPYTYNIVFVHPDGAGLARIAALVDGGQLHAVVDATFSLDQIAAAHDKVEEGHSSGKVVVAISAPSSSDLV